MANILVVVDYQNDFVTGSLGFSAAEKIKDGIVEKIREFGKRGDYVICTQDTHYRNYLQTVEGKNLPIVHCMTGTAGHEIVPEVWEAAAASAAKFIEKVTFPSSELMHEVRRIDALEKHVGNDKPDTIEFCGVVTDICVLSNVIMAKAGLPDARIIVHKNLCASNNPEMEEKAFDIMRNLHVEVI